MTPQFREALQAVNRLTSAEKQELFQIVITQDTTIPKPVTSQADQITRDAVWVGRPFTTLEDFAFAEWPEDESAISFSSSVNKHMTDFQVDDCGIIDSMQKHNSSITQQRKILPMVKKVRIDQQTSDFAYWQNQPPANRLATLEQIRREYIAWKYDSEPRFQRVYTIVKR